MRCNVARWDRWLRMLFGVLLMAWSVAGGPSWGYTGVLVLLSGASGFCPIYALLGIRTLRLPRSQFENYTQNTSTKS